MVPGRVFARFQIRRNQERKGKTRTNPQKQGGTGVGPGSLFQAAEPVGAFGLQNVTQVEKFGGRRPRVFLIWCQHPRRETHPRRGYKQGEKERPREV